MSDTISILGIRARVNTGFWLSSRRSGSRSSWMSRWRWTRGRRRR